jgi:hypothetical protein
VDEEANQEGFKEDNDWERSKNMEIWDGHDGVKWKSASS